MLLGVAAQHAFQAAGLQAAGQGRQSGWWIVEHQLPERGGRLEQDAAVLQQGRAAPELGATDAFGAIGMHQIGGGAAGEAAGAPLGRGGGHNPELQRQVQGGEDLLQPAATQGIGLLPPRAGRSPGQGVGELTGVQHRPAAAGAADQIDHSRLHQGRPVGFQPLLMAAERERGAAPAVEPQHGCLPRRQLVQHPAIEGHLVVAIGQQRRDPAPGLAHAADEEAVATGWRKLATVPCRSR
jgi:hypothetical protein